MAAPKDAPDDLMMAMGGPPEGGTPNTMDPSKDCVPLAALNLPDDAEQMQSPEVGDKVQFTKEGTVERIEGDQAYITVESVNGQPVEAAPEEAKEPNNPAEDADQLQELQDMAGKTQIQ